VSDTQQGPGWWLASDGKWYPPQSAQTASPLAPPAPVAAKKSSGCLKAVLIVVALFVLAGIGLGACLALAGDEIAESIENALGEADPGDYDLVVEECTVTEFGMAEASGLITNTSDTVQGFQIEIRFSRPDGVLIGVNSDFVDRLEIDQAGQWRVIALEEIPGDTVTCEVAKVSYSIFDR
jgi:hypothetical protein